jgi:potassium large conductance calcium-activated channel subfamily M alpha protein 1
MTFDDTFSALPRSKDTLLILFNSVEMMVRIFTVIYNFLLLPDPAPSDSRSPLGAPIVLQRRGTVFGASMPMITELVNDSNVQVNVG